MLMLGWTWGLLFAPPDAVQGNSYRIIFLHVPAVIFAELIYFFMALCALMHIVWRVKLAAYLIKSAAPNPFNAQIKIFYQISSAEDIVISIHDNLGSKILQHKKQNHSVGFHTFVWNGKNNVGVDVSSGVYIFSITSSLEIKTKKLVYLK